MSSYPVILLAEILDFIFIGTIIPVCTRGADVLSPTRKKTNYSDQIRDLFKVLPMKLNTLLSPLLQLL